MEAMRRIRLSLLVLAILVMLFSPNSVAPARLASADGASPERQFSLFKDIYAATAPSEPYGFFDLGSRFLFSTRNYAEDTSNAGFWASDGTPGGTIKLKNPISGRLFPYNGKAYFLVGGDDDSSDLWATDGTPQGTQLVYDFDQSFLLSSAVVFEGWLYFPANIYDPFTDGTQKRLWRTDGTTPNTTQISDKTLDLGLAELLVFNQALYFNVNDPQSGYELWRLPSADGQPELVKDICRLDSCAPFKQGSDPHSLTATGKLLFFIANDATHGAELWATDGEEAGGAHLVMDLRPGSDGAGYKYLTAVGDWLYFLADDGVHGERLWRTDGSLANTRMVENLSIYTNRYSGPSSPLAAMNGALYVSADDGVHGIELWKVTGSQAELIDILPGAVGSVPDWLTVAGTGESSILYFSAQDSPGNRELWRSDGTTGGTRLVKDIVQGKDGSWPSNLIAWKDKLVFSAIDAVHDREPWVSDGTTGETYLLADMNTSIYPEGSMPFAFKTFGAITYFNAGDTLHGRELWRTDGTPEGTFALGDFAPGPEPGNLSVNLADLNGIIYFAAPDNVYAENGLRGASDMSGAELWRSDGTRAGTWQVKDIWPGPRSSCPSGFSRAGDSIYFFANDGIHGEALWKTDGTAGGTVMVTEVPWSYPQGNFFSYKSSALSSTLIFYADYYEGSSHHGELWRSGGTPASTAPFFDFGDAQGQIASSEAFDGKIFWKVLTDTGFRMFSTDGTTGGTHQILTPQAPDDTAGEAAVFGGNLYFTTASPYTESTADDTTRLWKLAPGSISAVSIYAFPQASIDLLTRFGEKSLIFRVTAETGSKWWFSDGTSEGTYEICPACAYSADQYFTIFSGQLYFDAYVTEDGHKEIWVTDLTAQGTRSLFAGDAELPVSQPGELASSSAGILFSGYDDAHGQELWTYGGQHLIYLPSISKK